LLYIKTEEPAKSSLVEDRSLIINKDQI